MKKLFFIVLASFIFTVAYSQVKLNLLDGNQIKLDSYVFHSHEGYMTYTFANEKGKIKNSYAELDNVYSININNNDSILYQPMLEGEFSLADMTQIVVGKQYSIQEYKPWWALASGLVVGCGSMFIPMNGTTKLMIPIAYNIGMAFVRPSDSYILKRHDDVAGNEMLLWGYKSTGRKKIFKNTVIGTIGGIFISGIIWGTLYIADQ